MTKRLRKSVNRAAKSGQSLSRRATYALDAAVVKKRPGGAVGARSGRVAKGEPLPRRDRSVPATQAKNRFGEILQAARDSGPVFIERHGQAQAVVLGIEAYNKLSSNERTAQERELDYWAREFDTLHARMQTRQARQAVDALFAATDHELNRKRGG